MNHAGIDVHEMASLAGEREDAIDAGKLRHGR